MTYSVSFNQPPSLPRHIVQLNSDASAEETGVILPRMPSVEAWKSERLGYTIAVGLLYNWLQLMRETSSYKFKNSPTKFQEEKSKEQRKKRQWLTYDTLFLANAVGHFGLHAGNAAEAFCRGTCTTNATCAEPPPHESYKPTTGPTRRAI